MLFLLAFFSFSFSFCGGCGCFFDRPNKPQNTCTMANKASYWSSNSDNFCSRSVFSETHHTNVLIPGGWFVMGEKASKTPYAVDGESPRRKVKVFSFIFSSINKLGEGRERKKHWRDSFLWALVPN